MTVVLFVWVVGLGIITLWSTADPTLCFWDLVFCAVLLLPGSHLQYLVLAVPVLWIWVSAAVTEGSNGRRYVVAGVMIVWWYCLNMYWPTDGASAALSSVRYVVPFFASLVALTFSVLGGLVPRHEVSSGSRTAEFVDASTHSVAVEVRSFLAADPSPTISGPGCCLGVGSKARMTRSVWISVTVPGMLAMRPPPSVQGSERL